MPLARSPQGKKDAQSLQSYTRKFYKSLDSLTPWTSSYKNSSLRRKYGKEVEKSGGQIIVMLDANDDPNNPLFKDTHKISSR